MSKVKNKGFTLVELIIVITITSVLATTFFYFIKRPMQAYANIKERADIVDEAYVVIHRIKKDVQASLPNSIRITTVGNQTFIEMLLLSGAGKYRSQLTSPGTGDILDFTTADTSFDVISSGINFVGGESIVIANLGFSGYDAYNADNRSAYTGVAGSSINNITIAAKKFPLVSEYDRFYIVNQVVTYVCDTTAKTIRKYQGYTISTTQPNSTSSGALVGATNGLIARNVESCSFVYDQGVSSRNGFLGMTVKLSNNAQFVNLYGETYVPNN